MVTCKEVVDSLPGSDGAAEPDIQNDPKDVTQKFKFYVAILKIQTA